MNTLYTHEHILTATITSHQDILSVAEVEAKRSISVHQHATSVKDDSVFIINICILEVAIDDQIAFCKIFCSIDVVEVQSQHGRVNNICTPLSVWQVTDEYDPSVPRMHWHDAPTI